MPGEIKFPKILITILVTNKLSDMLLGSEPEVT